jgi:hypothetical protein
VAVETQEDTIQGLLLAATRVKTMPTRPAIKRSSIMPWWWLIIPKAFSNLLGLKGGYLYRDEYYWT